MKKGGHSKSGRLLRAFLLWILLLASQGMPVFAAGKGTVAESGASILNEARQTSAPVMGFQVFSDTHVMASQDPYEKMGAEKLISALQDIRPFQPRFLVINGDLTNGKEGDYQRFQEILKTYVPWPVYPTMGNHEYYEIFTNPNVTDGELIRRFTNHFHLDKPYYDRYINGYHFIFLAPEDLIAHYKQVGNGAYISEEQLSWFRHALAQDQGRVTFVFLHQPLDGTVTESDPGSVQQTAEIRQMLREHKGRVVWFSGHTHASMKREGQIREQDNVLFVGGATTFTVDNSLKGSESRLVEVYNDRIVLRVRDHITKTWGPPFVETLD